jgi:hypothetical protein
MSSVPDAKPTDGVPTYLGRGDPREKLADTPYAEHFLAGDAERT